jgi:hypothetical protein
LLLNVSKSYINLYGSKISHSFEIIVLEDSAFVIIDKEESDFNFPAFSPLSDDYIIQMYPAKDG